MIFPATSTDTGIPVGGFIGIVITMLILNVAGVIAYYRYKEHIDWAIDRFAPSSKLDSALVPKLRYGTVGLLLLSWIFSVACTAAPCDFVKVKRTATVNYAGGSSDFRSYLFHTEIFLGLNGSVEFDGECYGKQVIQHEDARIESAYAFGVINNLLTTTALIGCLLVTKFNVIKDVHVANKVWKIMGFLTLASTWCCLFTFYIQESTVCTGTIPSPISSTIIECSLAGAGVAQVFNSMFLIGICVLFFVIPYGDGDPISDARKQEDYDPRGSPVRRPSRAIDMTGCILRHSISPTESDDESSWTYSSGGNNVRQLEEFNSSFHTTAKQDGTSKSEEEEEEKEEEVVSEQVHNDDNGWQDFGSALTLLGKPVLSWFSATTSDGVVVRPAGSFQTTTKSRGSSNTITCQE